MKKAIPYILIAALLFILFLQNFEGGKNKINEPQTIEVDIPEVSGDFEPQKPMHSNTGDSIVIKWKEKEILVPNPVNDSLAIAYQKLSDSLTSAQAEIERYKMYLNAIQIRDFESYFEDEYLELTITGKVQGKVKSIKPQYTIKERTVETQVQPKQTVFRLLGGLEFGNNTSFNDFRYKANLGFQNRKGNIFSLGYERYNGQDYIFAAYDFSIFQIRR